MYFHVFYIKIIMFYFDSMQRNKKVHLPQKWGLNEEIQKRMMNMIKEIHIIKEIRDFKL